MTKPKPRAIGYTKFELNNLEKNDSYYSGSPDLEDIVDSAFFKAKDKIKNGIPCKQCGGACKYPKNHFLEHQSPKPRARGEWETKFIDRFYLSYDFPELTPEQCDKIMEWIQVELSRQRKAILPTLYSIRANIPLTWGRAARKQMKELIELLEAK